MFLNFDILIPIMKILQAVHLFYPEIGGIEIHTYNLSRALCAMGRGVEVFTTGSGSEDLGGVKVRHFFSIPFPMFSSVRFSTSMFFAMLRSDADIYCSH